MIVLLVKKDEVKIRLKMGLLCYMVNGGQET